MPARHPSPVPIPVAQPSDPLAFDESSPTAPRRYRNRSRGGGKKWILVPVLLSAVVATYFVWRSAAITPARALRSALDGWVAGRHPEVAHEISFCDHDRSQLGLSLLEYKIESSREQVGKTLVSSRLRLKSVDGRDRWESKQYSVERVNRRWRIVSVEDPATQAQKFEQWLEEVRKEAKKGLIQEQGRAAEAQIELAVRGTDITDLNRLHAVGADGKGEEIKKFQSLLRQQADRLDKEAKYEPDPAVREVFKLWLQPLRRP